MHSKRICCKRNSIEQMKSCSSRALQPRLLLLLLVAICPALSVAAAELDASPLSVSGFLDVTAPPYLADNSGRIDCTAALQRAVDDARAQFLAVYLPHGTYTISDTITLLQVDAWDPGQSNPMNNTWPCRCGARGRFKTEVAFRDRCVPAGFSRMWWWGRGRCSQQAPPPPCAPSSASHPTARSSKTPLRRCPCWTSPGT